MPTLTIRKITEEDKRLLRIRAAHNDRSMEEEARTILHQTLIDPQAPAQTNLVTAIRDILDEYGLEGVELPDIPREPAPEPPSFK